jgi:hypothetical protein
VLESGASARRCEDAELDGADVASGGLSDLEVNSRPMPSISTTRLVTGPVRTEAGAATHAT